MSNPILQTGASFFLPGYATYRYLGGDLKARDLPFSVAAMDLLSFVPTTANAMRCVQLLGRATTLSSWVSATGWGTRLLATVGNLSAKTGRLEVVLGTLRFLPLLIAGAGFLQGWRKGDRKHLEEKKTELVLCAVLFGAGLFHQALVARQVFPALIQNRLHPAYVDSHMDRATGLFALRFPKKHPESALLRDPLSLDFRTGSAGGTGSAGSIGETGTRMLGPTETLATLKFLRLQKGHFFGNRAESLKAIKAHAGRWYYWLSRSRLTSEGLENLYRIPEKAILVIFGSHQSAFRDYAAPWALSQKSGGGFNRLATASMIADIWNYCIGPEMRFSTMGGLLRKTLGLGFIRRKPWQKGLARWMRWLLEWEFHIQDALFHPVRAFRAGILKGLGRYVQKGGRICSETMERLEGKGLTPVFYPHGTRTRLFYDNAGNILGGRVLSGITHGAEDVGSRYRFIKTGTATFLRNLQEAAGEGRQICAVGFHRENPITPKLRSDTFGLLFREKTHLNQSTQVRLGVPRLLHLDQMDDGQILNTVEQIMIETSLIRERLLTAVLEVCGPSNAPAVWNRLATSYETFDHRFFIVFERILAIFPNQAGRIKRQALLREFQHATTETIDDLALEVNRALGRA